MTTLAPIGMAVYFTNAGIQSFKSAQRIQDHAEGKGGVDKDKYKVQLMIEGAEKRAERVMQDMVGREGEDFLPDEEAERKEQSHASKVNGHATQPDNAKSDSTLKPPSSSQSGTSADTRKEDVDHLAYGSAHSSRPPSPTPSQHTLSSSNSRSKGRDFPTLALTDEQFTMKESLDSIGFKKYPVHIHKANHSHAAIIVRMQRPGFGEGKVVARHWTERFEV